MLITKQQLANYITSQDYVWRLLYARGDVEYKLAPQASEPQVHQFLEHLSEQRASVDFLSRVYYLCQPDLARFLESNLEELLRSASRVTSTTRTTTRDSTGGRIDWPSTYLGHRTQRLDPTMYIARFPMSSYNVPENQLLKLFLNSLSGMIADLAHKFGTTAMVTSFLGMKDRAELALKRAWVRGVDSVWRTTALMRQRARRSRNWRYGKIEELQSRYEWAVRESRWQALLRLLRDGWLEPIAADDLFEIYTLVKLTDHLWHTHGFGEPIKIGLIGEDRREIAVFTRESDGATARIYFDQSPITIFNVPSLYKTLVQKYPTWRANPYRPDLTISVRKPSAPEQRVFFECKYTDDVNYRNQSVYKGLAYMSDFDEVWVGAPTTTLKVVMVFPGQIDVRSDQLGSQAPMELVGIDDDQRLDFLLHRILD